MYLIYIQPRVELLKFICLSHKAYQNVAVGNLLDSDKKKFYVYELVL